MGYASSKYISSSHCRQSSAPHSEKAVTTPLSSCGSTSCSDLVQNASLVSGNYSLHLPASHSLVLQNSLCSIQCSYLYYTHSFAQRDERHGNLSQEHHLFSNKENAHSFRAEVDSKSGTQVVHIIFIEYTRSGQTIWGCQYCHSLYIPAPHSYSTTFTAPHTFLIKASFCMDEVLDPAITKLLIDSQSKECSRKNCFEDENGS